MRSTITIAVLLAACFNPLASAGDNACTASAKAVPVCTVLSDAAKYDGKEITVRGLYRMVIHGSILMGTACPKANVNMRSAPDYKANKHALAVIRSLTRKDQFQSVDVVLRGTFRVAHQGQCFGQNCELYEIEDHELMCAQAPEPEGRPGDHPGAGRGGAGAPDLVHQTITEPNPGKIAAQIPLGLALFRQGKYADSVPAYERALALERGGRVLSNDQHRIVTDQLAMAYGISGQLGKAHGLLDAAIARDATYPLNYYNLACTFAEEGEKGKALASLDLAFQRGANVLKRERMPDPWTDASFQKYVRDPDFIGLMKKLGIRSAGTLATGTGK